MNFFRNRFRSGFEFQLWISGVINIATDCRLLQVHIKKYIRSLVPHRFWSDSEIWFRFAVHQNGTMFFSQIIIAAQSHYREVPRWEIFMEQESRFGLDLGRFGNFWGQFFHVFMGKFFLKKHCRRWKHKWHRMKKSKKKFRPRNIFNCVLLH